MNYPRVFCFLSLLFGSYLVAASPPSESAFFVKPNAVALRLSPNGKHVVFVRYDDKGQKLMLLNPASGEPSVMLNTEAYTEKESAIRSLRWLDDRYVALQFSELREGVENLLDTKISHRLLVLDTHASPDDPLRILSVRTKGFLVHALPEQAGKFLYAKSAYRSRIYTLDVAQLSADKAKLGKLDKIDGGQFTQSNVYASVDGFALRWYLSRSAEVEAVMHFSQAGALELGEFSEDKIVAVKTWKNKSLKEKEGQSDANQTVSLFERVIPIAKAKEANTYYGLDSEEDEDRSVYKVDFSKKTAELVYETGAFEIIDIIQSDDKDIIGVQVIENGAVAYEYLDDAERDKGVPKSIKEKSRIKTIIDGDTEGERFILYHEAHDTPGYYSLVDTQKKTDTIIAHRYPQVYGKLKSDITEGTYKAGDLEIPYLLNLPTPASQALPMIVMPHGGPIGVHDDRYYDPIVQFLVSRGYAVLRVNFRGSSGHSAALKDAGKGQWGNKMLSDIHGAASVVVQREDIDAKRVCTMGFSYGGYAAAALLALHPDFYQCGLSIAGVSDISLHINDSNNKVRRAWYVENVGDPATQYDAFKAVSPAYMAGQIKAPLFIAHGKKDTVVDVEHSHRLALMMKKYGRDYTLHIDDESGHHFSEPVQQRRLFSAVMDFLKKSI